MKSTGPHIKELFQRYLEGTTNEQELNELLKYFELNDHTEELKKLIYAHFENDEPSPISQERIDKIAQRIDDAVLPLVRSTRSSKKIYRWVAFASAAALLIFGIIFYNDWDKDGITTQIVQSEEILPGTNRATLTIDDGETIALSESEGLVLSTGDTITYGNGKSIAVTNSVQWATISTPRAGQYRIVLDDGTKVWLNAASRLRYPTHFPADERRISVSGEVYLEVARNENKPFVVETDRQTIRVLGTKFNIQAYDQDDSQSTTLVEGSVEVFAKHKNKTQKLSPNQQVRITSSGKMSVTQVEPYEYTAWTDGLIVLNSLDLEQVARQLERWYDVTFDPIPQELGRKKVFGSLKRNLSLKDVLVALESNYNVEFIIQGRRITVSGI